MANDSNNVLLVAGDSPARTITEALYLWKVQEAVVFDEVHVLTTATGRDLVASSLLDPSGTRVGAFTRVCRSLRIPRHEINFGLRTVHVVPEWAADRVPALPEVRADATLRIVQKLCAAAGSVTVAVGDDVGATVLLAASLQLSWRASDRFFWIREHPRFTAAAAEGRVKEFWMPECDLRLGRYVIAKADLVQRLEIPPVPDRQAVGESDSYMAIVRRRSREQRLLVDPAELTVDLARGVIEINGGAPIRLTPMQLFWYAYLATIAPKALPLRLITEALSGGSRGHAPAVAAPMSALYARLFPHRVDEWPAVLHRACGPEPGLRSTFSKVNATLRDRLGIGSEPYEVEAVRGEGEYRLSLPRTKIRIVSNGDHATPPATSMKAV